MLRNSKLREFFGDDGAIIAETLIVVPTVTLLTVGILEFGNLLWQRQQLQVGVRDAARYWSRCDPAFGNCSVTTARNIAFYGTPSPTANQAQRVPGWNAAADLTITPSSPPEIPTSADKVVVTGTHVYQGTPIFGALNISPITFNYSFEIRYLGW